MKKGINSLISKLISDGVIKSQKVQEVMSEINRKNFVDKSSE